MNCLHFHVRIDYILISLEITNSFDLKGFHLHHLLVPYS
nr:MAG TPA: hypothetical protein [Caudoviricetes sp.]